MRYRQLPPAATLDDIEAVWRAVPCDPTDADDCCARICTRTAVETRANASAWLVFLAALDCVTDDGDGYYRSVDTLDDEALGDRFASRLFAVPSVLDALDAADRPLTSDEVADRLDADTRRRLDRAGPEYLDRLLSWAAVLDRVSTSEDGYTVEG